MFHMIIPVYLILCALFGGASAAGYLGNLLLQLLAIPIIFWSLAITRRTPISHPAKQLLLLVAAMLILIFAQLIPLPPMIWSALPGRELVTRGFRLLGEPLPWLPISLVPSATVASLLWWLPALAVLIGTLRLGAFKHNYLVLSFLAAVIISVALGAAQIAAGPESSLYFYRITNRGFAVGTFANNNHMATMLLAAVPFIFALLVEGKRSRKSSRRMSARVLVLGAMLLLVVVGLLINTSLAGMGLFVPVLLASLCLLNQPDRLKRLAVPVVSIATLASVAVVLFAPLGNNLIGAEAEKAGSRYDSIATTLRAAADFAPIGSGLGSFQAVYRLYEDPAGITNEFMNHAHSDLAEILLELGVPGSLLLGLLLIWWLRQAIRLWFEQGRSDIMGRAAAIASAAILAHSLVDYPLRTASISALLAVLLAFMAQAKPRAQFGPEKGAKLSRGSRAVHLSADHGVMPRPAS
jgi:O-antigen ligase